MKRLSKLEVEQVSGGYYVLPLPPPLPTPDPGAPWGPYGPVFNNQEV